MNDDPNERRTRYVQDFLVARLVPTFVLDTHDRTTWTGSRVGWNPPVQHEGLFVFHYSPGVISDLTADLHTDEVDKYLRAIVAIANVYVIHDDVPAEQRTAVVEAALYDAHRGSMELLVHMELVTL